MEPGRDGKDQVYPEAVLLGAGARPEVLKLDGQLKLLAPADRIGRQRAPMPLYFRELKVTRTRNGSAGRQALLSLIRVKRAPRRLTSRITALPSVNFFEREVRISTFAGK